jgi:aryl-alcohol dehydrogenase-like predicted oxidoreductase
MHYRRLGKAPASRSANSRWAHWVTFGAQVDGNVVHRTGALRLRAGREFFDNADVYGQRRGGSGAGQSSQGAARAKDLVISSKVFFRPPMGLTGAGYRANTSPNRSTPCAQTAEIGLSGPVFLPPL